MNKSEAANYIRSTIVKASQAPDNQAILDAIPAMSNEEAETAIVSVLRSVSAIQSPYKSLETAMGLVSSHSGGIKIASTAFDLLEQIDCSNGDLSDSDEYSEITEADSSKRTDSSFNKYKSSLKTFIETLAESKGELLELGFTRLEKLIAIMPELFDNELSKYVKELSKMADRMYASTGCNNYKLTSDYANVYLRFNEKESLLLRRELEDMLRVMTKINPQLCGQLIYLILVSLLREYDQTLYSLSRFSIGEDSEGNSYCDREVHTASFPFENQWLPVGIDYHPIHVDIYRYAIEGLRDHLYFPIYTLLYRYQNYTTTEARRKIQYYYNRSEWSNYLPKFIVNHN